ncbi:response regulator transcription factor [Algoriphagus hitonicola]|uniref:Regulatory protein, luxR family n=1 Tax=Algoriphagus hitonicola TaxID=435880 RepID=A0A1I2QC39_9BACT|nr:helix-turn-helix transcriptional regulator [Algoriphagus hitonicola]SFG25203.1 regulatory protein, luxR family [Algoriphagus hitonicola]
MVFGYLHEALKIKNDNLKSQVLDAQYQLEELPDSYFGLFWLYTHDYLYISRSVENILGHPYSLFEEKGVAFLQTIIPENHFENIYSSLDNQAKKIEEGPEYLNSHVFLKVDAAILNQDQIQVPVRYQGILLDARQSHPVSYLVLGSWIKLESIKSSPLYEETILKQFKRIKTAYIQDNQKRFKSLSAIRKISQRESEIIKLLAQGHSTKSISEQLHISFNTVESHRKNLLHKLEAKNTAELVYKFNQI